ncbi:MAG: choice-of-anchor Q domain-containing protein, partial [Candidatus Omnitrophota bacterium]|nr:choice-of-anchor Q domain-containing protein [Candidatus Omnitrophota bacterium]
LGKTYYLGEKYYVDGGYTGGSNDGSWTHPWTSIKTAVANVTSGNKTIIVRGAHDSFNGIYVETGITPKAGTDDAHHFMIVGYGQERPIVDGNYSTQDMIGSTGQLYGYTTVQRLRLQNNSRDGVHWGGTVNGVLQDRDRYNYLIDVDFYNIGANPSYHTNAPIYYLDAPNGWIFHVTVKHTLMHCIKIGDGGDNDLVEWTVAGECGYWPGVAAETGITDFRTQLYQYPRCLDFPNDSGQIAENTIARYNIAYDGLYGGVQIRNSYNFSFHHNEIYNSPRLTVSNMGLSCANVANPCAQVLAIGEPANQVNTPLDKVYMYSNVIRDSGEPIEGAGIGIHSLTDGHTVYLYNNLLYSNPKSEISLYAYTNIVPYPYSSRRVEILNNTLWHGSNYNAALFIPNYSANKWGDEEVAIKNNIITNTASGGYVYGEGGGARSTTNYDYNLYYYPNNGRLGASAGLNDYAHGASTNSLFVAEPFGAYSWGMGNLLPSSPAKDSGLNLSALFTSDFNLASRPQGSAWDIGAYEYVQNLSGDVSGDGVITTYDAGLALQLGRGALEAAQIAQEAVD